MYGTSPGSVVGDYTCRGKLLMEGQEFDSCFWCFRSTYILLKLGCNIVSLLMMVVGPWVLFIGVFLAFIAPYRISVAFNLGLSKKS